MAVEAVILTIWLAFVSLSHSQLFRFAKIYGDHMVLQQSPAKASVWGYGIVGQSVSVTLVGGETVYTTVGSDSIWQVFLYPHQADGVSKTIQATSGGATIKINDVLFGDVWICSGQSNMVYTVDGAFNASTEIPNANNYPHIRLFTVNRTNYSTTPLNDLQSVLQPWSIASSTTVANKNDPVWSFFSATCWYYARFMYDMRKVPMGMINSAWGNTQIAVWMPPDAYAKCGTLSGSIQKPSNSTRFGSATPSKPSNLWNNMIFPLIRTTIEGAIWYQGERDTELPTRTLYGCRFPAMINAWRQEFSKYSQTNSQFPFGFVQLSTWTDHTNNTCGDKVDYFQCNVGDVRWGQTSNFGYVPNARMSNTFMATAIDYGDPDNTLWTDIHPRYKMPIGQRLARAAMAEVYKSGMYWLGPYASSAKVVNGQLQIKFLNVGSYGLKMKNSIGFEVEINQHWHDTVLIRVDQYNAYVKLPTTSGLSCVRYNWYNAPCMPLLGPKNCAIYGWGSTNEIDKLPALPFIMNITDGGCSKYTERLRSSVMTV